MTRINPSLSPALTRPTSEPVAQAPVAAPPRPVDRFEGGAQGNQVVGARPALPVLPATVATGGPNDFQVELAGHYPPVAAGGFLTELHQGQMTASNSLKANKSIDSHGADPSDADVRSQLSGLSPTRPTGEDNASIANYSSTIPGTSASAVYQYFRNHPQDIFGAGGINVRPAPRGPLQDGQRLMLEVKGSPNMWMPIELRLDPAQHKIDITTLDGHPFRGTNNFQFTDDGKGGTKIQQDSTFQGSSQLIYTVGEKQLEMQHETWAAVHGKLYSALAHTGSTEPVEVKGSSAAPVEIADYRTAQSRITLADNVNLSKVTVNVDITHPNAADLKIWLVGPQGQVVPLADHDGSDPSGMHRAFDLSSSFAGKPAAGSWTLCVSDNAYQNTGTVNSWSIDAQGTKA